MKKITLTTPENIHIDYEIAGLGSRMIGAAVDHLLQLGIVSIIFLTVYFSNNPTGLPNLSEALNSSKMAIVFLLGSAVIMLYFIFFETIWAGQTPGKKLARIQVVRENGEPIGFTESLIRNVFRMIDFLPFYYLTGIVMITLNSYNKRLGDTVAGTLVVRHSDGKAPETLPPLQVKTDLDINIENISAADYSLVRSFLIRRSRLDPIHRGRIGKKLAQALMKKTGFITDRIDCEEFIETVAMEYGNIRKAL